MKAAREAYPDKRIALWFQDEARVGQKGRTCHRWWTKGQHPPGLCDQRFEWAYIFGAVEPATGKAFSLTRRLLESAAADRLHIVAVQDDLVIGNAGLERFGGPRRHVASLGMMVADDHAGRGVGKALLNALIEAADDWLDIRRIELTVFTDNASAIRLYEKTGFETEGTLRSYAFRNGRDANAFAMARLRTG